MSDLISRQDAIKSMAKAIWHYPNELYTGLNSYEACEALAKDGLMNVPPSEPEVRCIAEIKISKDDLEELVDEKANDFLNFLIDLIDPNEMEEYIDMYNSQGEAEE